MSSYMHFEMMLFLQSAGIGALLVLGYDFFSALRRVIPHHRAAVALEDLFFWLSASVCVFAGLYRANQGILRSFLFLGMILGAVLCRRTISAFFVKCLAGFLGIPVIFAKFSTNRLLFLVKRCKIYACKFADSADRKEKTRFLQVKRSRQVGKVRKRKRKKNIE